MKEEEYQRLKSRDSSNLEKHEIVKLLEHEIQEKGKKPTSRDLKGEDWSVSDYLLRSRFGSKTNGMWRLGYDEGSEWKQDEEIIQHEIRGLEHELERPPTLTEVRDHLSKRSIEEKTIREAGIPYRNSRNSDPEDEGELVAELKEEIVENNHAPERLSRSRGYSKIEVDLFQDEYLPWIDEGHDFEYGNSAEVIRELAEGKDTLREVAETLDVYQCSMRCVRELKEKDLIETVPGKGSYLTEKGRDYYESRIDS